MHALPPRTNALIGKAYALLHSPFNVSVLVDGDSWICVGWLPKLQRHLDADFDVAWTLGLLHIHYAYDRYETTPYVAGLSGSAKRAWPKFLERNTGTVVIVRKSNLSDAWLQEVLTAYPFYEAARAKEARGQLRQRLQLGHNQSGHTRVQPAWREATFKQLRRGLLREVLLPNHVGCRAMGRASTQRCTCECECTECLFLHDHAVTQRARYDGCAAQAAAAHLQRCNDLASTWLSPLAQSTCELIMAGWNQTPRQTRGTDALAMLTNMSIGR